MSDKSDYLENGILDHVLRNTALTSPTTVYAALYTSNPGEDDSGTEVSGGGYARQPVTFSAPAGGTTANVGDLDFPVATADWGTVSHVAIKDSLDGTGSDNLLYFGALDQAKAVNSGDAFRIPDGDLDITEL